jgi:hypothetical protein
MCTATEKGRGAAAAQCLVRKPRWEHTYGIYYVDMYGYLNIHTITHMVLPIYIYISTNILMYTQAPFSPEILNAIRIYSVYTFLRIRKYDIYLLILTCMWYFYIENTFSPEILHAIRTCSVSYV